jgi:membrane protein implicated in regulation of membrane protease activity
MSDSTANSAIGWTVVGVCILAYPFVGFWGLFFFFVLAALLFAWIGLKSHQDFVRREERAEANHRRRQAEIRAQLNQTRAETGRVKAHVGHLQTAPVLWGQN